VLVQKTSLAVDIVNVVRKEEEYVEGGFMQYFLIILFFWFLIGLIFSIINQLKIDRRDICVSDVVSLLCYSCGGIFMFLIFIEAYLNRKEHIILIKYNKRKNK
jgi:hypothetical protein